MRLRMGGDDVIIPDDLERYGIEGCTMSSDQIVFEDSSGKTVSVHTKPKMKPGEIWQIKLG